MLLDEISISFDPTITFAAIIAFINLVLAIMNSFKIIDKILDKIKKIFLRCEYRVLYDSMSGNEN